jgi:hypothetical protein
MVGRQDGSSGGVLVGATIEGVNRDAWVRQRPLGVNGSRGGRLSKAAGGGIVFFKMGHVLGL